MDISGCHFKYDGTLSEEYNLIFANVDTSTNRSLSGNIETSSIFSRGSKKRYYLGDNYADSAMSFDAEIVTYDGDIIDPSYVRMIEKWLFYQNGFKKLYIDPADDYFDETHQFINNDDKYFYLNCRFISPERIYGNGGIVGYKFIIESDSCMLWQDPIKYTFNIDNNKQDSIHTIVVNVDTDINDYVYPKVVFQTGATGGNVKITNSTHEPLRYTEFKDLLSNQSVTMIGNDINYISGNNFSKFTSKNFIRLLDGKNLISIEGDIVDISFEFQNRRYL